MSLKVVTQAGLQRVIQNVRKDVSDRSLEYDVDLANSRIGLKTKAETDFTYTQSLTGKSGASVTDIYEDNATNEIVFVITDDAAVSAVNTDTEPMSVQSLDNSITEVELQPNVFYTIDQPVSTLTITCAAPESNDVYSEYMLQFTTGSSQPTVIFENDIRWVVEPNCQPNMIYQMSILNNIGVIVGTSVEINE